MGVHVAGPVVAVLSAAALTGCAAPQTEAPADPSAIVTSVELSEIRPGFVEVVAQGSVRGIEEGGGRCRFTFWAANGAASRLTTTGVAEAGETRCGPVSERAGWILPYGSYEVELRYDSKGVELRSDRVVVVLAPASS